LNKEVAEELRKNRDTFIAQDPSTSAQLFSYDEPPSPASRENPLESGPLARPPLNRIPFHYDNPASPEWNRRTIGEWFRTVMSKCSYNLTPCQMPSDGSPQFRIPLQTRSLQRCPVSGKKRKQPLNPLRRVNSPRPLRARKLVPPTSRKKRNLSLLVRKQRRGPEGLSSYNVHVSLSFSMSIPSWISCGRADNSGTLKDLRHVVDDNPDVYYRHFYHSLPSSDTFPVAPRSEKYTHISVCCIHVSVS